MMSGQTRLFVGNIPENANECDLKSAFSQYGTISNIELKQKSTENDTKKFAFISLSGSNFDIESCIKYFSKENFKGSTLYVTRARESFLERLQRERQQTQQKNNEEKKPKSQALPEYNPVIKLNEKLNPRKRKTSFNKSNTEILTKSYENKLFKTTFVEPLQNTDATDDRSIKQKDYDKKRMESMKFKTSFVEPLQNSDTTDDRSKKQKDSDKKRMESMKRKREEFKQKQSIIKTSLIGVDRVPNKKVIFSDSEETTKLQTIGSKHFKDVKQTKLFDEDEDNLSDQEVNFEIKKQFEGKKGQKVLNLQARYKSDKRFVLDERFIDEDDNEEGLGDAQEQVATHDDDMIEVGQVDEKEKQLNILQDVLGVTLKSSNFDPGSKKPKTKLGMLRFDPSQPEHARFLAPVEELKKDTQKKTKNLKTKEKQNDEENKTENTIHEVEKVEVSKEQFYKVSDTLKEAIAQPTTFSLRSLFAREEEEPEKEPQEQDTGYIPLEKTKGAKVKNPLEPREKNPFVYDSSDSEGDDEADKGKAKEEPAKIEIKAVWKENLFFSESDERLREGLAFFNRTNENEGHKERRELKYLMKKRIYNKDRKNNMFQKKIGGRKKTMKKSYRKKVNLENFI